MPFSVSWHTLLEHLEELPPDGTFVTPLSRKPFRITDVQEHRVLIAYHEDAGTVPLQREQFETLYERVHEGGPVSQAVRNTRSVGRDPG